MTHSLRQSAGTNAYTLFSSNDVFVFIWNGFEPLLNIQTHAAALIAKQLIVAEK